MTEKEARKYIEELFRIVSTTSILIVDSRGEILRKNCPFRVVSQVDIPPDISEGNHYYVDAVKMSLDMKDVFIIRDKGYNIWWFLILLE